MLDWMEKIAIMKRMSNLYEYFLSNENLYKCYREVLNNTKNKKRVNWLLNNKDEVIEEIKTELKNDTYKVGPYNFFTIYEPKKRLIASQGMKDKIVNHMVARGILYPALLPSMLPYNVASRQQMGTRKGIEYVEQFREYYRKRGVEKYYVLKCDISKFFQSVNHKILKEKLRRKIKDPRALKIVFQIIDSYKEGLGIGSMTSQVLAIFFLNDMDHYIKEELGIKCYVRYQDDFLLYSDSKEYLECCKKKIIKFLKKEDLVLNNKTEIYSNKQNFIFIGRNQKGQYSKRRNARRRLKEKRYFYFRDKINIDSYISSIVGLKKLSGIKNL